MSEEIKKEARKQYFHYFRIWFIVVGIMLVATVAAGISYSIRSKAPRGNADAPEERVYDYADVLTDEEEENLREYIAKKEKKYHADFVIVTISQAAAGEEAKAEYGYDSTDFETNMMAIADDFWDENGYGYNKSFEGDGSILVDNRYPVKGEAGECLSTSGRVENSLDNDAVEQVLYAVDEYWDTDPYLAYRAYIDEVCVYLDGLGDTLTGNFFYGIGAIVIVVITALIYSSSHLGKNKATKDVKVNAYVSGGKPVIGKKGDAFLYKNVTQRRIESSSSGGSSGGHSSGGGGHHVSSSGASHGGGVHRH